MSHCPPTPAVVRYHREMLLAAVAVIGLACALRIREDERVYVPGLSDYPLPHTCLSYAWFGVRCPGCGLTRSLIALAHGDWRASWSYHRLGWLLAAAVVAQVPYRLAALRQRDRPLLKEPFPRLAGYALIALLLVNRLVGAGYSP